MAEVDFRRVGTAYKGTSKKGNSYLHIKLNPDLIDRIPKHDLVNSMYIFNKKNKDGVIEYQILAPLTPREE